MQQRHPNTHTPLHPHAYIYIHTPVPGGQSFLFLLHAPTHLLYIGLYWNIPIQNIVFTALFIPNNYTYFDLL